mgnify:CR=1 FL=1
MQREPDNIAVLKNKIEMLEIENRLLKSLLNDHHISYDGILEHTEQAGQEVFDEDQGGRIHELVLTEEIANRFFKRFWGRRDVYDLRYVKKETGKAGYYTQCYNFWKAGCHKKKKDGTGCQKCEYKAYKPLNLELVYNHMKGLDPNGNDVLAIYPMLDNNMCRFLVFDFDNHVKGAEKEDYANIDSRWKEEVDALRNICKLLGIDALVERSRSGRGAHIWIFFEKPISARLARQFGFALLDKGAETINLKSFSYYDRMIPTQDVLPEGGIGNVVALPLQGLALRSGNSAFIDENWNAYHDQLDVLWNTKALSEEFIQNCITIWNETNPFKEAYGEGEERVKPWESAGTFEHKDSSGIIDITLSNMVYLDTLHMRPKLQNQVRHIAAFGNPVFFKNQVMGLSNFEESRYIYLGKDENGYIGIPRGLTEKLFEKLKIAGIGYRIIDRRSTRNPIHVEFQGELRESQIPAVEKMLEFDNGILSAATAFGKTVVCSSLIAKRKVNTLILLESSALIEQWISALERFLIINEELPEYKTPSGQVRKRKSLIGWLQGAHDSMGGIVDIAMAGSLCKKGEFHPLLEKYGMILVDECHHSASETLMNILGQVKARYVYGVTATPMRGDGKEKINYFLLGPIRYKYSAKDRAKEQGIEHLVFPRFTRTVAVHTSGKGLHPNAAYELVRKNEVRDEQIISDIMACIENGRTPVVLTKYTDHAEVLYGKLENCADNVILMLGGKSKKEQRLVGEQLAGVQPSESLIIVATGQLIGEGFDYPRLDTLIMATPVSGRNVVEQYAGRLNRDYEGKKNVIIYDYVDNHVPMFERMYAKRLRAYKQIGYELCSSIEDIHGEDGEGKQKVNAIYDIDNYLDVYWGDLLESKKEIIISSPSLNNEKVNKLIRNLALKQEMGLKVTIVTWHPDVYKYGKSDVRMSLLDRLKKAGFKIWFVEGNCEHFAVIDQKIVWYGSMNLLSKEDAEDNLMRVYSEEIAAELLEMTFGGEMELLEE